jgi:hypothetical protein
MESETRPNKAHHEKGQKEPLDPVKIASTNARPNVGQKVDDYWPKEWIKVRVSAGAEGDGFIKVRTFPALKALPTN